MLSFEPVPKTTGFSLVKGFFWVLFYLSSCLGLTSIRVVSLFNFIRLAIFQIILVRFGFEEFGFYNTSPWFGVLVYRATGYQNPWT